MLAAVCHDAIGGRLCARQGGTRQCSMLMSRCQGMGQPSSSCISSGLGAGPAIVSLEAVAALRAMSQSQPAALLALWPRVSTFASASLQQAPETGELSRHLFACVPMKSGLTRPPVASLFESLQRRSSRLL